MIAGAKAQLEQAERDVARYTELVAKNATTLVTLNNAQTQVNISRARGIQQGDAGKSQGSAELLHASARRSGRISMANVKVGNFVRQADTAPLATIIQMAPVYVTFTVPQRSLPESARRSPRKPRRSRRSCRAAKPAAGQVTMIENTVDTATGMVTVRATMPNTDEVLWPGTLVTTQLTLRIEEAVVVPSAAVQVSQTGTFVFVVKDGVATVRPVKVERTIGRETVIATDSRAARRW